MAFPLVGEEGQAAHAVASGFCEEDLVPGLTVAVLPLGGGELGVGVGVGVGAGGGDACGGEGGG